MEPYNALDIARYIINYSISKNKSITNLQLQKIMYYVQAAGMVSNGIPIFSESIKNWKYGPVIEEVYQEFRVNGHSSIPKQDKVINIIFDSENFEVKVVEKKFDDSIIDLEDKNLIIKVVDCYLDSDPFDLVEKTHSEAPWKNSNQNEIICINDILDYYRENENKIYNN